MRNIVGGLLQLVLRQDGLLHFVAMPLSRLLQCNFFVCCNATFSFAALLSRLLQKKVGLRRKVAGKGIFLHCRVLLFCRGRWCMIHGFLIFQLQGMPELKSTVRGLAIAKLQSSKIWRQNLQAVLSKHQVKGSSDNLRK